MKRHVIFIFSICCFFVSSIYANEIISLATLNWQPFYGENLPKNGFYAELSREAFKNAGYDLRITFVPWKRAVIMARIGKYDGLLGAYYNKNRANSFFYTDPVAQSDEVFVQKAGRGITYATLKDLKKYKIGVIGSGAKDKELREKGFDIDVHVDEIMGLKKLNAGRFDLLCIGKQQLYFLLQSEDFNNLQNNYDVLEPAFKTYKLYNPITKKKSNGEEIVNKFNKALQEMKTDGTYDRIMKEFGQK